MASVVGWASAHHLIFPEPCAFCGDTFMDRDDVPGTLREGYADAEEYHWVCARCAADLAKRIGFTLVGGPGRTPPL